MRTAPATIFTRRVLYTLGRRFGIASIDLYQIVTSTLNKETGAVSNVVEKTTIKRPLLLDSTETRKFAYAMFPDRFKVGALFDTESRLLAIPNTYDLEASDYFVRDREKFAIDTWNNQEGSGILLVLLKRLKNEVPTVIIDEAVESLVYMGDDHD